MRIPLAVLVTLVAASASPAATAFRASIEQLGARSVLVVRTRCVSVEARFTDDRKTIETYVKLETIEDLGGGAPVELTVRCRGGRVGDKALLVPGQAKFAVDEEDVVFLRKDPHGAWRVLGWCQGKFRIVRDPESGSVEAVQDLEGLCFVRARDDEKPVSTEPFRLTLADLASRVASARPTAKDDGEKPGDEAGGSGEKPTDGEKPDASGSAGDGD